MPMPSAKPPSDMMLSDTPASDSGANVMRIETGIETATMAVLRKSRRKKNNTPTASKPPNNAVLRTSAMLDSMKVERSDEIEIEASCCCSSRGPKRASMRSRTRAAMSTMLASASL